LGGFFLGLPLHSLLICEARGLKTKKIPHVTAGKDQKIMSTIVARLQVWLFWLFDVYIRTTARQGHFLLGSPTCLKMARLWVRLVDGDPELLKAYPRHDLTHLALGLGVSVHEEILVDISDPYMFGKSELPNRSHFEFQFMSRWSKHHRDNPIPFWENCHLLLAMRPQVFATYRRLEFLLHKN
jgi:hypothetical protein